MASASSKSIPFIVLVIAVAAIGWEHYSGMEDVLESLLPILASMGVAGAAKSAIAKAAEVRKTIPKELENTIIKELEKKIKTS